jgi:aldehyde:ferredoxin oxidoreductase
MGPWVASPLKERGYRGDNSIESLLYSLATGDRKSREELDQAAERIFLLHRALTIRGMGTRDMRTRHDTAPNWIFEYSKDRAPLSPGNIRMDREDIRVAMDMFYTEMGWDKKSGAPTFETYRKFGLEDIGKELNKKDLVP